MLRCFRTLAPRALALLLTGTIVPATTLQAQMTPDTGSSMGQPRSALPRSPDADSPFRDNPELRDRLQRGRAAERQRRIVDDANRLVTLTAQYRQQVAAHGTPTGDDGKLLAEIEKTARDLKDRMRGM